MFSRTDDDLGEFSARTVEPAGDAPLLHRWLTHPKSVFWLMRDATLADVRQEFTDLVAAESRDAFLGFHGDRPSFIVETYDPRDDQVGKVYAARAGDIGMHFLVAPTDDPIHGFTHAVIVTVMELLFADPTIKRVVVEPDVRNHAVHVLNTAVGFRVVDTVVLPGKHAYLSICTREQYTATKGAYRRLGSAIR